MNTPPPGYRPPAAKAPDAAAPGPQAAVPTVVVERRQLDSAQLFGPTNEVEINHAGAIYRLRRTALGKLILTK